MTFAENCCSHPIALRHTKILLVSLLLKDIHIKPHSQIAEYQTQLFAAQPDKVTT